MKRITLLALFSLLLIECTSKYLLIKLDSKKGMPWLDNQEVTLQNEKCMISYCPSLSC